MGQEANLRACANCRHAQSFVVIPGVGSQDAESTRHCTKWGFAVGADYACPAFRKAAQ